MSDLFRLLSPRFLGIRNSIVCAAPGAGKRTAVMISVGLAFWIMMFIISSRVLIYFKSVEVIGEVLAHHLLAMIFLTFFSLLVFSHIITALSDLYLSDDLELCHSSPPSLEALFLSRVIYTIIDSSWMVVIFGLPVMMSYAYVFRPGPGYYLSLIHLGTALVIIAAGTGVLFTMIMVSIFPAQRTRDIIMLLMIIGITGIYFMFRFLRPERLVDPDAFFSIMQYVSSLKSPDSPYLPTHWVTEVLWGHLGGSGIDEHIFDIVMVWSTALAIVVINLWTAPLIYFTGFSKSQEAKRRRGGRGLLDLVIRIIQIPLRGELKLLVEKDVRTFFRDNTQWSQLLLLGALVIVYLYNFSVLPLERSPIRLEFLQNEIAFLNMGLAAFVVTAVSVRFIFPAISSEGRAFWIIQSAPVSMKRLMWGKFAIYILPMLILAEILVIATNYLLQVTAFMMILSSVTMLFAVFGIVALGIGFGAMYPRFRYENISQVATSFGGLMYMIFSAIFISCVIILEAGPVYIIFMANLRGTAIGMLQCVLIIAAFVLVLLLSIYVTIKPMRMGLIALSDNE